MSAPPAPQSYFHFRRPRLQQQLLLPALRGPLGVLGAEGQEGDDKAGVLKAGDPDCLLTQRVVEQTVFLAYGGVLSTVRPEPYMTLVSAQKELAKGVGFPQGLATPGCKGSDQDVLTAPAGKFLILP